MGGAIDKFVIVEGNPRCLTLTHEWSELPLCSTDAIIARNLVPKIEMLIIRFCSIFIVSE